MIVVNGKQIEWYDDITFEDIYKKLGYSIAHPPVMTKVEGRIVKKKDRGSFRIPDNTTLEITTIFRGG